MTMFLLGSREKRGMKETLRWKENVWCWNFENKAKGFLNLHIQVPERLVW